MGDCSNFFVNTNTPSLKTFQLQIGNYEHFSYECFLLTGNTCYKDDYCDGNSTDHNNRLLTFLLTTASSVLLFCLGYYYLDNRRQDSKFIATINSLQRDLLFATKVIKLSMYSMKNKSLKISLYNNINNNNKI